MRFVPSRTRIRTLATGAVTAVALAAAASAQIEVLSDPSSFSANATVIDFAGFEVPDTVSNEYQTDGVVFWMTGGGAPFAETEDVTQRPYGPADTTLIQNFPHGATPPFPELPNIVVDFTYKVNRFGFLIKNNLNDDAIVSILCCEGNDHIANHFFITSFNWQFIGLDSEHSFDRVVIDVTDVDNGAFRMDNLYFECDESYLCADLQSPFLDIVTPVEGQVFGTTSTNVTVEVFDTNAVDVTSTPAGVSGQVPAGGGILSGTVPLVEGSNSITVSGIDEAENMGGTSVSVIRDTIFPTVNILSPGQGTVFGASPASVTLSVTDATATDVSFGGNDFLVAAGGGVVAGNVDLVEGNNPIVITAIDAAGHSTIKNLNLVLDLTAPLVTIDSPASGELFGVGEEELGVIVTVDDLTETDVVSTPPGVSETLPPGGGVTAGVITMVEGFNTVLVTAVDDAARVGSDSVVVLLDTTPPAVTVDSPGDGAAIRGVVDFDATVLDVAPGSGIALVEFFVDGDLVDSMTAPPYASTYDTALLGDGFHTFTVTATDHTDNVKTVTTTSLVDNTASGVTINNPLSGEVVAGTIGFDALVDDPTSGVLSVAMTVAGSAPNVTDGSITFEPPVPSASVASVHDTAGMLDGDAILTVVAEDAAGNQTTQQLTVNVDNTAPERDIRHPAHGQFVEGDLTIVVEVTDANFLDQEILAEGVSLGVFPNALVVTVFDTTTMLDGRLEITSIANDVVGNSSSSAIVAQIDNMDVAIKPRRLNIAKQQSDTERRMVTTDVTGGDLGLLLSPPQARTVKLHVPGASPVLAESGIAFLVEGAARYEFDRQTVINAVKAGIANGTIPGDGLVAFKLMVDDREIGVDNVNITGHSGNPE